MSFQQSEIIPCESWNAESAQAPGNADWMYTNKMTVAIAIEFKFMYVNSKFILSCTHGIILKRKEVLGHKFSLTQINII